MTPGAPRAPGPFRKILRSPAGRITNQTLLIALLLVFGTGVATVAIGSSSGRWAGPEPARALRHRLLDPPAGQRRRPAAAGHPRGRGSAVHGPRLPAAPGRTRPARVLVGQVGRPDRTPDDALVVAAAVPGDLTVT